jgi:hypothetical protein
MRTSMAADVDVDVDVATCVVEVGESGSMLVVVAKEG